MCLCDLDIVSKEGMSKDLMIIEPVNAFILDFTGELC